MDAWRLRPPEQEQLATPPPIANDEEHEGGERQGRSIKRDLRHPYDRLRPSSGPRHDDSSRDPSPFNNTATTATTATRQPRPHLTINTTDTRSHTCTEPACNRSSKHCTVDIEALPSGSTTATNSGTPPSTTYAKAKRPKIHRNASSAASSRSSSPPPSAVKRMMRWLTAPQRRPDDPIPRSPTTPLRVPRRLSRLPSFFTRERLYLPQHLQRRDIALLGAALALIIAFVSLGIFAAVRPATVCESKFLQTCVDAMLPGLFIGAPYTLVVVGLAVSGWGKSWIRGRYTPALYVLAAALGKVGVGALVANLDWTVIAC